MAVDILTWNVRGGLAKEDSAQFYLETMAANNPTLATFCEATPEGDDNLLPRVETEMKKLGYFSHMVDYRDYDGRADRSTMLVAAKIDLLTGIRTLRLGGRNAIKSVITDPETERMIDVFSLHLDDRIESSRIASTKALFDCEGVYGPTIINGDLNAMHRDQLVAKLLRFPGLKTILKNMEAGEPIHASNPGFKSKLARAVSIGQRLNGMAEGTTMQRFEDELFTDADPTRSATQPSYLPLFQLDHILVSRELETKQFEVLPNNQMTDHLGISAKVTFKAA